MLLFSSIDPKLPGFAKTESLDWAWSRGFAMEHLQTLLSAWDTPVGCPAWGILVTFGILEGCGDFIWLDLSFIFFPAGGGRWLISGSGINFGIQIKNYLTRNCLGNRNAVLHFRENKNKIFFIWNVYVKTHRTEIAQLFLISTSCGFIAVFSVNMALAERR